jgi:transcriptional regulator with XRE-family HTH domain
MKVQVAKLGRPVKSDQISLEQVEVIASLGLTDDEIAIILGISERTLNYWKKSNPEFLQSLKRGKLKADFQIAKSLYVKALLGDTTAMIFWLKNRQPDRWRDRHQIDGNLTLSGKLSLVEFKKSMKDCGDAASRD